MERLNGRWFNNHPRPISLKPNAHLPLAQSISQELASPLGFGGYRIQETPSQKKAWFFLPGHQPNQATDQVWLEYHHQTLETPQNEAGGSKQPKKKHAGVHYTANQRVPLHWDAARGQWSLPEPQSIPLKADIAYRFIKAQQDPNSGQRYETPLLDLSYEPDAHGTHQPGGYNVIPKTSHDPTSLGPILLNFPDALVNEHQLSQYLSQKEHGDLHHHKRTPFNVFGGDETARPFINRVCRQMGFVGVEDRPVIGGDALSAHGYWTNNLFQLNPRIRNHEGFEQVAMDMLANGGKWFFDGAFLNEGLNGVHYLSNLYWKESSPFMKWFDYGDLNQFPHEPIRLGVLPVKPDPITGDDVIDNHAWDLRFIPPTNLRNPEAPWHVELYDPRLEDEHGRPRAKTTVGFLTNSQMSVQRYRFPVRPEEMAEKQAQLETAAQIHNPVERANTEKLLKRSWKHFTLDMSAEDFSSRKWDGQRDVARLNIENPEVVQYFKGAMTYWGDKLSRLYTHRIGSALAQTGQVPDTLSAALQHPQALIKAVDAITKPDLDSPGLIAPLNRGEDNPLTSEKLMVALKQHQHTRDHAFKLHMTPGRLLAQDVAQTYPLETLPAPPLFQAVLSTPDLKAALKHGTRSWWQEALSVITTPVAWLTDALLNTHSEQWFRRPSFEKQLADKLDGTFKRTLPKPLQDKLADPLLNHLAYEPVARSLYLSLLTGQYVSPTTELDSQQATKAYSQSIPSHLMMAPPRLAAQGLAQLMTQRLNNLDLKPMVQYLAQAVKDITIPAAVVAKQLCTERRFGAHLRVDAAKELGDMDHVRNIPDNTDPAHATQLMTKGFRKELEKATAIMNEVGAGLRSALPTAVIKPELTDFGDFLSPIYSPDGKPAHWTVADNLAHKTLLGQMMRNGPVNGIPNMRWFFQAGMGFHISATRPDDAGGPQLSPAQYLAQRIKPMMTVFPMDQTMMFQNMTTSHDYPTMTFNLFKHNRLFRYDHISWFKLVPEFENNQAKGDANNHLLVAMRELEHKPQLGFLTHGLPKDVYGRLLNILANPQNHAHFSENLRPYFYNGFTQVSASPYPVGIKAQFADEAARVVTPEVLGLSPAQHRQLFTALKAVLVEPSEVKCIRGTLSNHVHELAQTPAQDGVIAEAAQAMKVTGPQAKALLEGVAQVFDKTFWDFEHQAFSDQDRRWLGYQQLDYIIDWTVDRLPTDHPTLAPLKQPQVKQGLKQTLFNHTINDALEQFKRVAAMQVALPGDPTFYLPDLLGQAGGENIKNMFLGNRELIRTDWLKTNPRINRYFNELAPIIRQRYDTHVLNNGSLLLPLDPMRDDDSPEANKTLNETGVVPLIRDNGRDQALCLINMGKSQDHWTSWQDGMTSTSYPTLKQTQQDVHNYTLSLKALGIPPGTRYRSVDAERTPDQEWFVVNPQGTLVRLVNGQPSTEGMSIHTTRTLMRIPKPPTA